MYFDSQKTLKINENSGIGSESPLEASGVGFWEPWRLQKWIPKDQRGEPMGVGSGNGRGKPSPGEGDGRV